MTMRSWIRDLFNRPGPRPFRKALHRIRPFLEALEDRWVPSTYTVTNILDDGIGSLRWAIGQANGASEASIIDFEPSVFNTNFQTIRVQGSTGGDNGFVLSNTNWPILIVGPSIGVRVEASAQKAFEHVNHMFWVSLGVQATISNLSIVGGFDESLDAGGGGLYNAGTLTMTGCIFQGNVAYYGGGGLYNFGTASLTNCRFSDNSSFPSFPAGWGNGGAIYNSAASNTPGNLAILTLTDCTIHLNTASGNGGGIFNANKAYLNNCIISDNTATSLGGGLYNSNHTILTDCALSGNAASQGGGLNNNFGSADLTRCAFSGNSAGESGGGLYSISGTVNLTSCTLSGNTTSGNGGGLYNDLASEINVGTVNLNNCTVSGNSAESGGALYNSSIARLTNCTVSFNEGGFYGGGVYNDRYYGTLSLNNCTFSGNHTADNNYNYYGGGLYNDGNATLVSCTFTNNTTGNGGGWYNNNSISLTNTIVAGNTGLFRGEDVFNNDQYTTGGYNLIGFDEEESIHAAPTDQIGTGGDVIDAKLAPLGNYGGPTQTHALLLTSPAIHRGYAVPGTLDQRGLPLDSPPDVGAFQTQSIPITPPVWIESPLAGIDSYLVVSSGSWTAKANVTWLHTTSKGSGNGVATFTFDANSGATRTGTLTIAGQTLTVTQAGKNYIAANPVITLTNELNQPTDVAVDVAGNVYIADEVNSAIYMWNASTQQVATLVSSGLNQPQGVTVDLAGNVYIADTFNNAIKVLYASTSQIDTLVSSGLCLPTGVAVDSAGNVYFADTGNNAIKKWNASTRQVSPLISSGLSTPVGVAVDVAGNIYIADEGNNAIRKWNASTQQLSNLASSGGNEIAVDAAGNVYFNDSSNSAIKEWNASTKQVTSLVSSGLSSPTGVAVDTAGNVYIVDTINAAIKVRVNSYVPTGVISEGPAAGSDALAVVLPTKQSLTGSFAPSSDQPWLTLGNIANGVINYSFTANSGAARSAHITVLGQQITVTQLAALGSFDLIEEPAAGSDSVIVAIPGAWTAVSNVPWMHTSSNGNGSGLATFTFDTNLGPTRTGTLTIADRILTVTQAGSSYVAANPVTTLVSTGLTQPHGVTVDAAGNVYFADPINNTIKQWNAATLKLTNLVSTGLNDPTGLSVDMAGNVFIADSDNNAIKKWDAATQKLTTLVSAGLKNPTSVSVDTAGNVYIADTNNNVIKKWNAATQQVSTLVSSGINRPSGLAVDAAGNVYFVDLLNSAIKKWNASTRKLSILVSSGVSHPSGVAVDSAGNVYFAGIGNNAIKRWNAATQHVSTLVSSGINRPSGMAVDAAGSLIITYTNNNSIKKLSHAYVPGNAISVSSAAGLDSLLPILPSTQLLTGPFAPISDQPWLTIGAIVNGVIHFAFTANTGAARTAHISVLGQQITVTQANPLKLGTNALLQGPAAGTDTDIVTGIGTWTATSNVSWLHTSSSGDGNGVATFTFDANNGATRTGTLTIGGQTLTVTQAGTSYVSANPVYTLASGLKEPSAVAVDTVGNVYIADQFDFSIKKWIASTQQLVTLVSTGLNLPQGVAVDAAGNVYIADTNNNAIKKWNISTKQVTTLVSTGLSEPKAVAVDGTGNIYIADYGNNTLKKWDASTKQVTSLVSTGVNFLTNVAVDAAGNVYVSEGNDNGIKKWNAATGQVTTVVSVDQGLPYGVAVDASGDVYFTDIQNHSLKKWNASTQQVTTLISSGLNQAQGVAVDALGNVYIADTFNASVKELVHAFVPAGAVNEGSQAGSDTLTPVLPTTQSLKGVYSPASDQPWLTIGTTSKGVVPFSFTANIGEPRTAHLTVLGQSISVTQGPRKLGTNFLVEGPAAGKDSNIVVTSGAWTAKANVSWLHTSSKGSGNGVVTFTFDANPGATRTGTLTIAGMTLTVTQAGKSYVAANPVTPLVSSGLLAPYGVAVDRAGNVYFADTDNNAIKKWDASTQTVATLVSTGLFNPSGVAVDTVGNVYITDTKNNTLKKWNASTQQVSTLVSTGLDEPIGVAVDLAGNVYIGDYGNNALKKWNVSTQLVTTLVSSGLSFPEGIALDVAGNVYIVVDTLDGAIKKWDASTGLLSTVVSTGLTFPAGVAVDAMGNLYIADQYNSAIQKWNASTLQVTTLLSSALNHPYGVAVDAAGNVYIADTYNNAITKLTQAYVPAGPVNKGQAAGSDALLVVLPATQSLTGLFAPTSDQSWLTIDSITNGIIHFSFTANTGAARTAHITVLGQSIIVNQSGTV